MKATEGVNRVSAAALVGLLASACSKGDPAKSWNQLATCLAGDAATATVAQRAHALRLTQLASVGTPEKERWPAGCATYANQLYVSLASSGDAPLFERKLRDKLACSEDTPSCTFPQDESLISTVTELWAAAQQAQFKTEKAPDVKVPPPPVEPAVTLDSWKSFSATPVRTLPPLVMPDGRALVLSKAGEGRGKPSVCELSAGFAKMTCFQPAASIPDSPLQTVELARDPSGIFYAVLEDKGMVSYDLKTGAKGDVRGSSGALVHSGLALEGGAGEEGFSAILLKDGKAGKPMKLRTEQPLVKPIALGDQVIWVEKLEDGAALAAKRATSHGLRDAGRVKGPFAGAFHSCQREGRLAVAVWDRRAGMPGAKATALGNKTQVAFSEWVDGAWSKAGEAVIPFERVAESELVCTKDGAALAYAADSGAGQLEIGRVDCASGGCKLTTEKLPSVESKWWWSVTPLGDQVLIVYRSLLGETRLRLAKLGALSAAKDVLVFDTADFGGPSASQATTLSGDDAALLLFGGDKPVAMAISAGSVKVLTPG